MNYNLGYINLKYTLIRELMINVNANILDISYSPVGSNLTIQVIALPGSPLPQEVVRRLDNALPEYHIEVVHHFVSKEQFNDMEDEWQPKAYTWLEYLLFSRASI